MARSPIFINLADLSGVNSETFRRADQGDRQAQKLMLRNLMTQEASAEAVTTGHWTDWMLRMIATGVRQATCDALGSIAEAARTRQITKAQQSALDELFEQYFGPGTVGSATAARVFVAFQGKTKETKVLQLFLLADRLAAAKPVVTPNAIWDAVQDASALGAAGATSFFRAVWAQRTYSADPITAFKVGLDAIEGLEPLAADDEVYQVKLGQLAILVSQIAEIGGEPQAGLLLRALHAERIAQYRASEPDT